MYRAVAGNLVSNVWPTFRRGGQEVVLVNGKFGFRITYLKNGSETKSLPSSPIKRGYMTRAAQEPFLNGSSSVYVEEMYRSWLKDPGSVHKVFLYHYSLPLLSF